MEIDTDNLTNESIRTAVEVYAALYLSQDIDISEYEYDDEKILNISAWNTSQVTDMSDLFSNGDANLKFNQDISNWDTSQVETMMGTFANCKKFNQNINWNTSKVKNMQEMFANCIHFNKNINMDTSQVENMNGMFYACKKFTKDISCWNLVNCTNYNNAFELCPIDNLNKPLFIMDGETKKDYLFRYNNRCSNSQNRLNTIIYNTAVKRQIDKKNQTLRSMTQEERIKHQYDIRKNPEQYKNNPLNPLFSSTSRIAHISSFLGPTGDFIGEEVPVVDTKCYGKCMPWRWWRGGKTKKLNHDRFRKTRFRN